MTKLEPATGPVAGDTIVKITGSGFVAVTAVEFGKRPAESFEVRSSTEIIAVSPPWVKGNAIAEVTVATMSETSMMSGGDSFIYEPVVTRIEPSSGAATGGTKVTITGEALKGLFENGAGEMPSFVEAVDFGAAEATDVKEESEDTVSAVSPPGTGTADVTVKTFGGTSAATSADRFFYLGSRAGPPAIEAESVSNITSSNATLEAQIDTNGLETTYTFYLEEPQPACLEAVPPCMIPQRAPIALTSGRLLGSFATQAVSVDLNSADVMLRAGERYKYWVAASNAAGEVEGAKQTFVAQEGGSQTQNTSTVGSDGGSSSGSKPSVGSVQASPSRAVMRPGGTRHNHKPRHRRRHGHHPHHKAEHSQRRGKHHRQRVHQHRA